MRILPAVLIAMAMLAPSAAATGQNDNGTGGDAPGDWQNAIDVPFQAIAGYLDPVAADHADWYRVETTPGKVLAWTFHTTIRFSYVYILDDSGNRITAYNMLNLFGGNGTFSTKYHVVGVDHVRIGVSEDEGSGEYWIELAELETADVQLDAMTIQRAESPADGVAQTSLEHVVRVNVSNQGAGATTARVHAVVRAVATGGTRDLGTREVALQGGEQASVSFDWHGAGQFGEMRVEADATSSWIESRSDNNHIDGTSHVLVNQTGFGVDLLNGGVGNRGVSWNSDGQRSVGVCVVVQCTGFTEPIGPAVTPTGNASGDRFAVSGTGSAHASNGVAISGTGASGASVAVSGPGTATGGLVGLTGTGNSSGLTAFDVAGRSEGEALAGSLTGHAHCNLDGLCVAITGTGEAEGWLTFGVTGTCNGGQCNDVEPTGDARSNSIAISGTGRSDAPTAISVLGPAEGFFATSGANDANGNWTAISGTGIATGRQETLRFAASAGSPRRGRP